MSVCTTYSQHLFSNVFHSTPIAADFFDPQLKKLEQQKTQIIGLKKLYEICVVYLKHWKKKEAEKNCKKEETELLNSYGNYPVYEEIRGSNLVISTVSIHQEILNWSMVAETPYTVDIVYQIWSECIWSQDPTLVARRLSALDYTCFVGLKAKYEQSMQRLQKIRRHLECFPCVSPANIKEKIYTIIVNDQAHIFLYRAIICCLYGQHQETQEILNKQGKRLIYQKLGYMEEIEVFAGQVFQSITLPCLADQGMTLSESYENWRKSHGSVLKKLQDNGFQSITLPCLAGQGMTPLESYQYKRALQDCIRGQLKKKLLEEVRDRLQNYIQESTQIQSFVEMQKNSMSQNPTVLAILKTLQNHIKAHEALYKLFEAYLLQDQCTINTILANSGKLIVSRTVPRKSYSIMFLCQPTILERRSVFSALTDKSSTIAQKFSESERYYDELLQKNPEKKETCLSALDQEIKACDFCLDAIENLRTRLKKEQKEYAAVLKCKSVAEIKKAS